jgi:hypothetical protein
MRAAISFSLSTALHAAYYEGEKVANKTLRKYGEK